MRVRVRHTKLGKVRFTSHRDLARVWERTLRRAEVPMEWTGGFSPRPKMHFGLALSTGHESLAEYLDLDLVEGSDPGLDTLACRLSSALPVGVDVTAVQVAQPGGASLQEMVVSCSWLMAVPGATDQSLAEAVDRVLAAAHLPLRRERKGKTTEDDLRPLVLDLRPAPERTAELLPQDVPGSSLVADLGTQPRAVRPAELLMLLGCDPLDARVRRLHQWLAQDDDRREPLPAPVVPAARTVVRVP